MLFCLCFGTANARQVTVKRHVPEFNSIYNNSFVDAVTERYRWSTCSLSFFLSLIQKPYTSLTLPAVMNALMLFLLM